MQVEMRPINTIWPYENNPRLNDAAVDAVAASIRAFGFRQPIVVDEEDVIIVGHSRPYTLQSCIEAGAGRGAGPCRRWPHASPGQSVPHRRQSDGYVLNMGRR